MRVGRGSNASGKGLVGMLPRRGCNLTAQSPKCSNIAISADFASFKFSRYDGGRSYRVA